MRIFYFLLMACFASVMVGCISRSEVASIDVEAPDATVEASASAGGLYTVDDYDPSRDANADLNMTIEQAKAGNKRIILEIGGQW